MPVVEPNPTSRSASYSSAGARRCANWTIPTLLDHRMTSRSVMLGAKCVSVSVRPLITSRPACVSTTSVGVTRPRPSSAAAMNGFNVDPGSNGSVSVVAAGWAHSGAAAGECQDRPILGVEHDDVAPGRSHSRHGVVQRPLADLLKVAIQRQLNGITCLRRRLAGGRFKGPAQRVPQNHHPTTVPSQETVDGSFDSVGPRPAPVHMSDDARDPWRAKQHALGHRCRVDPAHCHRGGSLSWQETGGDDKPTSTDIHGPPRDWQMRRLRGPTPLPAQHDPALRQGQCRVGRRRESTRAAPRRRRESALAGLRQAQASRARARPWPPTCCPARAERTPPVRSTRQRTPAAPHEPRRSG